MGGGAVTSQALGEAVGLNPTQVRRDLMGLPVGGRRGVGYSAVDLAGALRRELAPHRATIETLAEQYRLRHEQLARVAARLGHGSA
jgi:NADH/NAD ratio-sensing transcriptional regulator Rex